MNHTPLLLNCTLIASLSLVNIGSAWSVPVPQDTATSAASSKYKAKFKEKIAKARAAKANKLLLNKDSATSAGDEVQVVGGKPSAQNSPANSSALPAAAAPTNPYMASSGITVAAPAAHNAVVTIVPVPQPVAQPTAVPVAAQATGGGNPFLAYPQALPIPVVAPSGLAPAALPLSLLNPPPAVINQGTESFNQIIALLKSSLPSLALPGDLTTILPVIKTVYPTGEKPLVVINFKCPTELIGISTPPMKALHEILNFGFDNLNKTNLLSFNLQQVCS